MIKFVISLKYLTLNVMVLNLLKLLVDIHFLVFLENKLWKYSCRKWYFPFPQFSPWSADWAWKRHKIGHLAGPGESLRRLSATHPKLNPFHLLKLLMNVSSQCIPMEFNTFTDWPYLKTMSYFVPHSTFQKSEFSSSMFPEGGGEIMGKQCVWSLSQIKNVHNCRKQMLYEDNMFWGKQSMFESSISWSCAQGTLYKNMWMGVEDTFGRDNLAS